MTKNYDRVFNHANPILESKMKMKKQKSDDDLAFRAQRLINMTRNHVKTINKLDDKIWELQQRRDLIHDKLMKRNKEKYQINELLDKKGLKTYW